MLRSIALFFSIFLQSISCVWLPSPQGVGLVFFVTDIQQIRGTKLLSSYVTRLYCKIRPLLYCITTDKLSPVASQNCTRH